MLETLPTEITLSILSYFTLREVHTFQLVHSSWDAIIRSNEASVYLDVAINHGFVRPNESLEEAHWTAREDGTDGAASWRELCE